MSGGPERKCLATGEVRPQAELLRFVAGPDGQVVFDAGGKLPGRGLWLSARLDVLQTAAKKGLFSKAAKARLEVPEDLVEQVQGQLKSRCLNRLGLARRAGVVIQGFEKVRTALKADRAGVLIEAADAAPDGREKMARLAAGLPVVALFDAAETGQAIGRDNAVHVLLAPGKMANAFLDDARKLAGVLDIPLGGAGGPDLVHRGADELKAED